MTTLQAILLILAIPATLYQIFKISQIAALTTKYGDVRIAPSLYFAILLTLGIQAGLVLSLVIA